MGAKVHDFAWRDDFAAARNESLRHARGAWIFWLDGDEWLDDENVERQTDEGSYEHLDLVQISWRISTAVCSEEELADDNRANADVGKGRRMDPLGDE